MCRDSPNLEPTGRLKVKSLMRREFEEDEMDTSQTASHARVLLEEHGAGAELIAARRMAEARNAGNREEEEGWRRVRAAIAEFKGPYRS